MIICTYATGCPSNSTNSKLAEKVSYSDKKVSYSKYVVQLSAVTISTD